MGAGGPTVARWLATVVGAKGRVLASDIDVSWTRTPGDAGIEIVVHDVGRYPAPSGPFDLVHARLVLVHVPERDAALQAMAAALVPGGWLVVEEADPMLQPLSCPDTPGPEQELANRLRNGFRRLMAERGVDLAYGRTLPRRLRNAGLLDVGADAFFPLAHPSCATLERTTITMISDQLTAHEIATSAEIERHLANVASGHLEVTQPPMVSAWGRKPQ